MGEKLTKMGINNMLKASILQPFKVNNLTYERGVININWRTSMKK